MQPPYDYVDALRRGSMMITDYSGVGFDFAYMKKPIIYTQFDSDNIFDKHYYKKGYFDYIEDGFGDITHDYDSSIDAIIKMIESGCKMPKKYQNRVDKFFDYHDHDNSRRIYEAIIDIDKEEK